VRSQRVYQFAGVSFGGVLALEMARILEASDREVAIVVMIDAVRRDSRRIDLQHVPAGVNRGIHKGRRMSEAQCIDSAGT
jgi:thioesterase domain-containing protein